MNDCVGLPCTILRGLACVSCAFFASVSMCADDVDEEASEVVF